MVGIEAVFRVAMKTMSRAPGAPISTARESDGMSFVTTPSVVRQINSLFDGGSVAGLTDRQLIERFNDRRDTVGEAAFAALVARHGPMVLHTTRAALQFAAGHAAAPLAAALAREVLRSMLLRKLRLTTLALLFLGAVATGVGYLNHALAIGDEPHKVPVAPQPQITGADPKPAPGRMFVSGRVLDPKGEPVPGAMIVAHTRSLALGRPPYFMRQVPIGDARADRSGRFRIDAPRTSSLHHAGFGAVALAPGYGAGWVQLDPDDDQPTADIALRPEQVIHGRLFDVQGQPAPGVTVSVWSIHLDLPRALAARSVTDGVSFVGEAVNDFPGWPRPVLTDPEGRFTLRGLGRDLHVVLHLHHPRFALQRITFETNDASASKLLTAALAPAQILNVRVTYADTGEPVPHAPLRVMASQGKTGVNATFETDAEGRSRVKAYPTDRSYYILAYSPEGQPYLTASGSIAWPKGALEQSLDIALPRGVLIRGKVTEADSGKPVPGTAVGFVPRGDDRLNLVSGGIEVNTAPDGSFQLGAKPGPGYLFIKGPSDDYLLEEIGFRMILQGQPGGARIYAHAHIGLDLKPGVDTEEIQLALRRGVTVNGQAVGPDGQPVPDAWIISQVVLNQGRELWGTWNNRTRGKVRQGRFALHGVAPDVETPVYFLDPERKLGAMVNLSDKLTDHGPITVRLEPCGSARARLVDPDGKPVAGRLPRDSATPTVAAPRPPYSNAPDQAGLLFAAEADLNQIDSINYANGFASDTEGRLTLPVLIPGATYRFTDYSMGRMVGPQVRKEFTVKPGETLDLGDIRIEKPKA
jgi:hypothetical protein